MRAAATLLALLKLAPALSPQEVEVRPFDKGLVERARAASPAVPAPPAAPIPEPKSPGGLFRLFARSGPDKVVNTLAGCSNPGRKGLLGCCKPSLGGEGVGIDWRSGPPRDGATPVWAEKVEIVFTLSQTLHVTFARPEGTCEHEVTKRHEEVHAKDHRLLLESWTKRMNGELERGNRYEPRIGTAKEPVFVPTAGLADYKRRAEKKVADALAYHGRTADDSLLKQWAKSAEFRDSLDEYRRLDGLSAACRR